jgi:hypothetical protein
MALGNKLSVSRRCANGLKAKVRSKRTKKLATPALQPVFNGFKLLARTLVQGV